MEDTTITLTPAVVLAIVREMDEVTSRHVREITIQPENGTTFLVTFDAGYGTYSFHVNRNSGKTWQAGLGVGASIAEQPERYPGERAAMAAVNRGDWDEA